MNSSVAKQSQIGMNSSVAAQLCSLPWKCL